MKKLLASVMLVSIALFLSYLLFTPQQVTGSSMSPGASVAPAIPDSVMTVFQRACVGCHSDKGSGLAKGKLNFSKWGEYPQDKKMKKAQAICKEMKAGSMPTKSWRKDNASAIPTAAEVNAVCAWSATVVK